MSEQKMDKKLSDLLAELKSEYLEKLPGKIKHLRQVNTTHDWVQIEEEFHKLKGTGKTYGFPEVSQLCEKMESLAQHRDTQIPGLFDQAVELLERMLSSYQQGHSYEIHNDPTMKAILKLKAQTEIKRSGKGS